MRKEPLGGSRETVVPPPERPACSPQQEEEGARGQGDRASESMVAAGGVRAGPPFSRPARTTGTNSSAFLEQHGAPEPSLVPLWRLPLHLLDGTRLCQDPSHSPASWRPRAQDPLAAPGASAFCAQRALLCRVNWTDQRRPECRQGCVHSPSTCTEPSSAQATS